MHRVTGGNDERKDIYLDDHDRERFLAMHEETIERFGLVIYAYCLLSNHFCYPLSMIKFVRQFTCRT